MSVILDALKRVQDENRRRGHGPDRMEVRPEQGSSALLRRLSEPDVAPEGSSSGSRRWSAAAWIGVLVLGLVAVIGAALLILRPTLAGTGAASSRPLLSTQQPRQTPAGGGVAAQPASRSVDEPAAQQGGFTERLALAPPAGGATVETDPTYGTPAAASGGADMSDLSGSVGGNGEGTGGGPDSFMRLETNDPAPSSSGRASANGNGILNITSEPPANNSSNTASQRSGATASGRSSGSARLPKGLVDPGVKSAFESGVRLQKDGDLGSAEEAYKRALRFDPHNAKVNANLGVLYEELNRLSLAETHLRRSIDVQPDSANAHNNLGVVLYRQGNYDAAMIEFERTLELDPRRLDAYTNEGLIYIRWGQHAKAERAFVQVLTIDPENALAHYNLGMVYEEQQLYTQAIQHYNSFISLAGSEHPEITDYLDTHLLWLEGVVGQGSGGAS